MNWENIWGELLTSFCFTFLLQIFPELSFCERDITKILSRDVWLTWEISFWTRYLSENNRIMIMHQINNFVQINTLLLSYSEVALTDHHFPRETMKAWVNPITPLIHKCPVVEYDY